MAFDPDKYTTLARQQGIDPDVIDATIASHGGGQSQQVQKPTILNKVLDFVAPQTIKFAKTILNTPQMLRQWSTELKQNGPLAAPSPELRQLSGGSSTDTGNRFANSALDAWQKTREATGAGAEVGSLASIAKSGLSLAKKKIWPAVRYPTLKGAYAASTNAATNAGEAGTTINLDKVISDANTILDKGTQAGKSKLAEVVAKAFPEASSTVSPNVALETRGQLTQALPKGWFGKLSTSLADIIQGPGAAADRQAASEATNALRQSLTNEIHATIPKTATPDMAYSIWKKVGGDLPAWGKKIAWYEVAKHFGIPKEWQQYLPL